MSPLICQRVSAVLFAVGWTAWMMWWSGSLAPANIVLLALVGSGTGYLWYRVMRWQWARRYMLARRR